jgi:hypothetical protein
VRHGVARDGLRRTCPEGIVVSDQGETFGYLFAHPDDTTYGPWNVDVAKTCCAEFGVELVDDSDERSTGFRIRSFTDDPRPLDAVIDAVASAIDGIFGLLQAVTGDP